METTILAVISEEDALKFEELKHYREAFDYILRKAIDKIAKEQVKNRIEAQKHWEHIVEKYNLPKDVDLHLDPNTREVSLTPEVKSDNFLSMLAEGLN